MTPTVHSGTSSPIPCVICRTGIAEIRSDMGPVCRDCKAHLVHAENALLQAGIPPLPPESPESPESPEPPTNTTHA